MPGLGLEDPRGHYFKVVALALALASDGQVFALVMQVLALAPKNRGKVSVALGWRSSEIFGVPL